MDKQVYIMGDSDFLMHHGIKGQKWGVENGPPYPLSPSKDYSAAEKKANKIANRVDKVVGTANAKNNLYESIKNKYKETGKIGFGDSSLVGSKYLSDQKSEKKLLKARDQLSKLSNKYSDNKDIARNISAYQKSLDSIIKDFEGIKLNPEMATYGKRAAGAHNAGYFYGGIPGYLIATAASDNILKKNLDAGNLKF